MASRSRLLGGALLFFVIPCVGCPNDIAGVAPAAVPTALVFVVQPSNAATGSIIQPSVEVAFENADGVVSDTASVTISIGQNPGDAVLVGPVTVAAVSGVAIFSGLRLSAAGSGYTLTASAAGFAVVTSSAFSIVSP